MTEHTESQTTPPQPPARFQHVLKTAILLLFIGGIAFYIFHQLQLQAATEIVREHYRRGRLDLTGLDVSDRDFSYVVHVLESEKRILIPEIRFDDTSIGDASVSLVVEKLPQVNRLSFSGTNVSEGGFDLLKALPRLWYLEVEDVELNKAVQESICKIPDLKVVYCSKDQWSLEMAGRFALAGIRLNRQ